MNTARQEMMGALDRIEKRLQEMDTRFNERFAALDARVSSIETGRAVAPRPAAPAANGSQAPRQKRPQAAKPKVAPARPAPQNRLEIMDSAAIAPVSRVVLVDGRVQSSPAQEDVAQEINRIQVLDAPSAAIRTPSSEAACSIRSIQPGRVWIRRANGSFATYGVGDSLPDGRRVDSIDPNAGVQADGRAWNCG